MRKFPRSMPTMFRFTIPLILLLALCGCTRRLEPQLRYELNPAVLADGPPQPQDEAIASDEQISRQPEIEIDPARAVGYDRLNENLKELYGPQPMTVGLRKVVDQTLRNDRDIKIEGYLLQSSEFAIPVAESIYDLLIEASGSFSKNKRQTSLDLAAARAAAGGAFFATEPVEEQLRRDAEVSLSQLLPTGAVVQIAYTFSRVKNDPTRNLLDPLFTQVLTFSVVQPLLRGFGPAVTNADIHIAQANRRASAAEFEARLQERLRNALVEYWELLFEVRRYDVQLISYLTALDLVRINAAKVKAGVMAPTEELQARAQAEERRELVITARQRVRDAEDRLKRQIFFQNDVPAWDLQILPTQELAWREIEADRERVIADALEFRPEIRRDLNRIEAGEFEVVKARDDIKPQLDAVGSVFSTGIDDSGHDAFDTAVENEFNSYSIGLEFSFPFQNREARFTHKQRLADLQRTEETYKRTIDQVVFDVRTALRALETARERIDITRARVESEQANLEAERRRYDVGISTSFQVLEFQEDLAAAQEAYIRAVVDYNQAAIDLELARGTLLKTYGVVVDRPTLNPEDKEVVFPVGFN